MMIDNAKFFALFIGFFAALIPLIGEIIKYPNKININNLAFFYFLFIYFLIELWDYFFPILIEHPNEDILVFCCLVIFSIFVIYSYDHKNKVLVLPQNNNVLTKIYYLILFSILFISLFFLLISLGSPENSGALIDKPFAYIILISNIILVVILIRFWKSFFDI